MLSVVQTVGIIVAALASAYAVLASEVNRGLDARRAGIERVMGAVLALAEAALLVGEAGHTHAGIDVARRRLRAGIEVVQPFGTAQSRSTAASPGSADATPAARRYFRPRLACSAPAGSRGPAARSASSTHLDGRPLIPRSPGSSARAGERGSHLSRP